MVKNSYPNGVCPDCQEPIPDTAISGQACLNCGHVFWEESMYVVVLMAWNAKSVAAVYGPFDTDTEAADFANTLKSDSAFVALVERPT